MQRNGIFCEITSRIQLEQCLISNGTDNFVFPFNEIYSTRKGPNANDVLFLPSYAGYGSKIGAVASVDERVEL